MSAIVSEADLKAAHAVVKSAYGCLVSDGDAALPTHHNPFCVAVAKVAAEAREAENRECEARVTDHLVCRGPCRCDDNWCNGVRGISDAIAARREAQPVKVPG